MQTLLGRKANLTAQHRDACAARENARKSGDTAALLSAKGSVDALAEILEEAIVQEAEPLLAERARVRAEQSALRGRLGESLEVSARYNELARQTEALNDQLRPLYAELVRVRDSRAVPVRSFSL